MPINFYQGPGQLYSTRDVEQSNPFTAKVSELLQRSRDEATMQNMAEMAATRMSALGPQGQQWADMIRRDPRAAVTMADQYGGFAEIESSILGARAQGEAQARLGQLQQSGATPQQIVDFIMRTQGPAAAQKAAEAFGALNPTSQGPAEYETAQGVYIRDPKADGGYRYVGPAPAKSPLVQIGESGLKPEQAIAAEDRSASQVSSQTTKLQDSLDAYDALRGLVAMIESENREPNESETDSIIKLAARVENPEAVQEGDIYRKAGGGVGNWFKAKASLPPSIDRDRMRTIFATASNVAETKRGRIAEIQAQAESVAEQRGLSPRAASTADRRETGPPSGAVRDPSVPGLWVLPDGSGWMAD